jgi:hypothetical protein
VGQKTTVTFDTLEEAEQTAKSIQASYPELHVSVYDSEESQQKTLSRR